ncbi:unnamed protein product [Symbiodinium sp. CCMP2456]|nr:unnamed protein product [Symbiodinium sp. CCMP2456]
MILPARAPWMERQLPGQMQLSPAGLPADKFSRAREERMHEARLPTPRLSDESLQERLRSLEIECQQLRDSNSRLELENSKLKLQVSSSQGGQPSSEPHGLPSLLHGSISAAGTQRQVLRSRMRAMLEEQRRLVHELQLEIAEEMSLQPRPTEAEPRQPMPLASARSGPGTWASAHTAPQDLSEPQEVVAPPEEDPSWPTLSQPWPSSRLPENELPTRTSAGGRYMQSAADELNAPSEAAAPPEEDSPRPVLAWRPAATMPSRMGDRGSGRPLTASARTAPVKLPSGYMRSAPDELHSPWEAAAPPEEPSVVPPIYGREGSARQPRLTRGSVSGSNVAPVEAPPEDEDPPMLLGRTEPTHRSLLLNAVSLHACICNNLRPQLCGRSRARWHCPRNATAWVFGPGCFARPAWDTVVVAPTRSEHSRKPTSSLCVCVFCSDWLIWMVRRCKLGAWPPACVA